MAVDQEALQDDDDKRSKRSQGEYHASQQRPCPAIKWPIIVSVNQPADRLATVDVCREGDDIERGACAFHYTLKVCACKQQLWRSHSRDDLLTLCRCTSNRRSEAHSEGC